MSYSSFSGSRGGLFAAATGVSVVLRSRGIFKQVPAYVREEPGKNGALARRLYVSMGGGFVGCGADSTTSPKWLVDDVVVEPDSDWQDCVVGELNRLFLRRKAVSGRAAA